VIQVKVPNRQVTASGETPCCSGNPLEPYVPSQVVKTTGGQDWNLGMVIIVMDWAIRMLTTLKGGASETERVSASTSKMKDF